MQRLVRIAVASVVLGLVLSGCATPPPPPPEASRSIVLLNPENGETVRTVYWRGGTYDSKAMLDISVLFRDRRSGEVQPVDPALIDILHDLRVALGVPPDTPIHLTSGYRSPASNAILARTNPNVAESSYHLRAMAADIRIPGVAPTALAEAARALGRGGYAFYPSTGHVHVDTGPARTWRGK